MVKEETFNEVILILKLFFNEFILLSLCKKSPGSVVLVEVGKVESPVVSAGVKWPLRYVEHGHSGHIHDERQGFLLQLEHHALLYTKQDSF